MSQMIPLEVIPLLMIPTVVIQRQFEPVYMRVLRKEGSIVFVSILRPMPMSLILPVEFHLLHLE